MSTFYMYSPTSEQTDKESQDALSTLKNRSVDNCGI